jgi:hypothetical protein
MTSKTITYGVSFADEYRNRGFVVVDVTMPALALSAKGQRCVCGDPNCDGVNPEAQAVIEKIWLEGCHPGDDTSVRMGKLKVSVDPKWKNRLLTKEQAEEMFREFDKQRGTPNPPGGA